ncbi:MAG: twin-arginine translocation signal domain-containing protein, partial [Planctomycetes bacterium]|nr:twin-arginine translocation signal domain-containing protein [Planctomycetota bacterium]
MNRRDFVKYSAASAVLAAASTATVGAETIPL